MSWQNALNNMNPVAQSARLGDRLQAAALQTPGQHFFVDSTVGRDSADMDGKSWGKAKATIDAAVNLCTASHGDVIWVAPYHTETLGADSAVDVDVVGVAVIGIRMGRQMPTLNATAIEGDFKLAAASCTVANIRFTGGVDATTGCIEVSAADCAVLNCEYRDVTGQATDALITVNNADRLIIDGFKSFGAAGAGANSAIALDGSDDCEIKNCYLYGNFAVAGIDLRTTPSVRVNIHDCTIWTANAADLAIKDTITASTGFIGPNLHIMLTDNAANITTAVTGATFQMIDPVYVCNLAGEKAMLSNWTASTHA